MHSDEDDAASAAHQRVVQLLGQAGLELSAAAGMTSGRTSERIIAAVQSIDQAIAELRRASYARMVGYQDLGPERPNGEPGKAPESATEASPPSPG